LTKSFGQNKLTNRLIFVPFMTHVAQDTVADSRPAALRWLALGLALLSAGSGLPYSAVTRVLLAARLDFAAGTGDRIGMRYARSFINVLKA
jgi:hypothetical protein